MQGKKIPFLFCIVLTYSYLCTRFQTIELLNAAKQHLNVELMNAAQQQLNYIIIVYG